MNPDHARIRDIATDAANRFMLQVKRPAPAERISWIQAMHRAPWPVPGVEESEKAEYRGVFAECLHYAGYCRFPQQKALTRSQYRTDFRSRKLPRYRKAAERSGQSLTAWIDTALTAAADKVLK